jgi:undecaprenyl-diphosphatase
MVWQKNIPIGLMLLGSVLLPAVILVLLAVKAPDIDQFDAFVRMEVHRLASPILTTAMQAISFMGSSLALAILLVVAVYLLYHFHRGRAAALITITMVGSSGLNVVLKSIFHRPRPAAFFGAIPNSYSFPSGHALNSLCFYGTIAVIVFMYVQKPLARWGIWLTAALIIGMIGFSRVYLGVHYPSDVIAGYCAGIVWVQLVVLLSRSGFMIHNDPDANHPKSASP